MLEKAPAMKSKYVMAVWNFLLAGFSFMGFVNTVPFLIDHLMEHGFQYTVCAHPEEWYLHGHCGLYVFLFIYSKIPELMDTVFLVLKKAPIIFLHWFHHCTVLLYCWHAYYNSVSSGLWFAAMNYTVHSIMYMYYGCMSLRLFRSVTKAIAPFITTIQILQMMMGMAVTVFSAMWHMEGGVSTCFVNAANYKLGLAMYTIYFILFAVLFRNLYCGAKGAKRSGKQEFCGVNSKTGMDFFFCNQSPCFFRWSILGGEMIHSNRI